MAVILIHMARFRKPKGSPDGTGGQFTKTPSPAETSSKPLTLNTNGVNILNEDPIDKSKRFGIPVERTQEATYWWYGNDPPVIEFSDEGDIQGWRAMGNVLLENQEHWDTFVQFVGDGIGDQLSDFLSDGAESVTNYWNTEEAIDEIIDEMYTKMHQSVDAAAWCASSHPDRQQAIANKLQNSMVDKFDEDVTRMAFQEVEDAQRDLKYERYT